MTIVSSIVTGSLGLTTLGSIVSTLDSGTYIVAGLYALSLLVLWRLWMLRTAHPDSVYALSTRYFHIADLVLKGAACFAFSNPGTSGAALISRVAGPSTVGIHPVLGFLFLGAAPTVVSLFASRQKPRAAGAFTAFSACALALGVASAVYAVNPRAFVSTENAWPLYVTVVGSAAGLIAICTSFIASESTGETSAKTGAFLLTVTAFTAQVPVGGVKDYMLFDTCPSALLLAAALVKSSLTKTEVKKENTDDGRCETNSKQERPAQKEAQTRCAAPVDIEDLFSVPKTRKPSTKKVSSALIKRKKIE